MACMEDRCIGSLLGVAIGDALGAAVEGLDRDEIQDAHPGGVSDYTEGQHMGVEYCGLRKGMYTDDTNCTLAVAESLIGCGGVCAQHLAWSGVRSWLRKPRRGYPPGAETIYRALLDDEADYRATGTVCFKDGSYANGGAMRIAPLGLVVDPRDPDHVRRLVTEALISTHVHPEAIDGAVVQCLAVALLVNAVDLDVSSVASTLVHACKTAAMQENLKTVLDMSNQDLPCHVVAEMIATDFQIRAIEAVPIAVMMFVRLQSNPEKCIEETIALGGDTDTIASLVGAMLGALHGTSWIPAGHRWRTGLENGEWGHDHIVSVARELFALRTRDWTELRSPDVYDEQVALLREQCRATAAADNRILVTPLQLRSRLPRTWGC